MAVSSVRNLMSGGGTVSTTSGSKQLVFSSVQAFKEGASVVVDPSGTPQYFTIDSGAGTTWTAIQNSPSTVSGKAFKTSKDASQSMPGARGRGGTDSYLIPNAAHFMYRSALDDASAPDFYTYMDTLFPENGMHPYTRDPYSGVTVATADAKAAVIPDIGTRVRRLEGALRSNPTNGDITDPDKRLDAMENRINLLEQWANRVGTNSPPTTVTVTTYTVEQLTQAGDQA
jgi:hypothetical protein